MRDWSGGPVSPPPSGACFRLRRHRRADENVARLDLELIRSLWVDRQEDPTGRLRSVDVVRALDRHERWRHRIEGVVPQDDDLPRCLVLTGGAVLPHSWSTGDDVIVI